MANNNSTTQNAESFDFQLYRYTPSLPAAIAAVAVFGFLTAYHCWLIKRHKSFYFVAFAVGGIFQTVGYCGRLWSHFDATVLGAFIIQALLILIAPALYAASIYMILGRLIRAIRAEHLSMIPVKWLTKIFVIGDVLSFTIQAGGGGLQSAGLKTFKIGEKIIVGGLFVQIIMFTFFVITAGIFHARISKNPPVATTVPWKRHLIVIYLTGGLILVRSVFRVVEFLQGNAGYLISHEIFLYIFDAVLMASVMAIFAVWYIADLSVKDRASSEAVLLGSMGNHAKGEHTGYRRVVEPDQLA